MYAHKRPSSHILGCLKKKKGKRETHLRRMCVGTARRKKKKEASEPCGRPEGGVRTLCSVCPDP